MKNPDNLYYTAEHLWVNQSSDGEWSAGITDYAQDLLDDIVFIQAPNVGAEITNGLPCGVVESVKTGSDLHAPMSGIVTQINDDLLNAPEGINDKPYTAWIFKFKPTNINDTAHFLSADAYSEMVKT